MVEKAKDIVERLRKESSGVTVNLNPWPTMREAADEIERLRAEIVRLESPPICGVVKMPPQWLHTHPTRTPGRCAVSTCGPSSMQPRALVRVAS